MNMAWLNIKTIFSCVGFLFKNKTVKSLYKSKSPHFLFGVILSLMLILNIISYISFLNELKTIHNQLSMFSFKIDMGRGGINGAVSREYFNNMVNACDLKKNKIIALIGTYQIIDNTETIKHFQANNINIPNGVLIQEPIISMFIWKNIFLHDENTTNPKRIIRTNLKNENCNLLNHYEKINGSNIIFKKNIFLNDLHCLPIQDTITNDLKLTIPLKPKYISYFITNTKDFRLSNYTYNFIMFISEQPVYFASTCQNNSTLLHNTTQFLMDYDLSSFL